MILHFSKYARWPIVLFFLFLTKVSFSQSYNLYRFTDKSYSKNQLKKDIENARNIDEVQKIIKTKIPRLRGEILIIFEDPVAGRSLCMINEKGAQVTKITLGTKSAGITEIQRINDLKKNIFTDTLVIMDSLHLNVATLTNEEDFALNGYYFYYTCSGSAKEGGASVPFNANKELVITKSIFDNCPGSYLNIRLFNDAAPDRSLAASGIFFPDSVVKNTLLEDVRYLISQSIETDPKKITMILACYLWRYGHVLYSDLARWVDQNYFSKLKKQ